MCVRVCVRAWVYEAVFVSVNVCECWGQGRELVWRGKLGAD